ncbi:MULTISPECIES: helix-turn-helix domain-containing GNAT family N-acetyltransferase [unclassified Herbaspirillum]|uniref:bifunctional helix-turn-helix transcriptional regulator/GNAT family N-acetyltransferase n=1 Tax=unclassified Herbaspirillum TaxID=2624150 RepID=UPI0011716E4F|nr:MULTISPECIES: helix-turn-helix domain-containing GNAT family N-acetyltransferase [unclassified Herbaspirillum]MBB5390656.1 DNA-binding MarR family transcriptional regulator/GNAT superfamily N-acetyltransferase [Herbaspirillum sp. SJZ102]TQK08858.1 MarR family transcriptional regulator with acetyltransferase activity [Herbaspirillum sp. SJZ130]TQK14455.1 MarR family transcriptional regulator with acetyltransferase activity [Herbaspirillum sp. SJZ106]
MASNPQIVEGIRAASRALVRELGFMGGDFAGTSLSPSAVHTLIELDRTPGMSAGELGAMLRLEKSSVSRMLHKLIAAGDIVEAVDEADARAKKLYLTAAGQARARAIHAFGRRQVNTALARLGPGEDQLVLDGLRLYAGAFADDAGSPSAPPCKIVRGYQPGIIARITQMHALYYARTAGFGQHFESVVAKGLAEFCDRLANPSNAIWVAMRGAQMVGSIAIDGEDLGGNIAHLRWFILDDTARGAGLGRQLLAAALAHADECQFDATHLWTFSGLQAARHLYEANGFSCVEETPGSQWGREVMEQRFVRKRPRHPSPGLNALSPGTRATRDSQRR